MPLEEAINKRLMPYSLDAEKSVIGAMFVDRDNISIVSEILTEEDFYNKQYAMLFQAITELNNEGKPADGLTVRDWMEKKGIPMESNDTELFEGLFSVGYLAGNAKYHADIIFEKSILRKLIKTCDDISNRCYVGQEETESILENAEKNIFSIVQKRKVGDFVHIRQIVLDAMSHIEMAAKNHGSVTGVATGFIDLDYKTTGLQPADLVLLAARPSMGKTALALNIAEYVAFRSDEAVAIFSLEMSKEQLVNRLFAMESKVDSQHIRTGNLNDREWEDLIEGAGIVGRSKLIIDDTPGISVSELRSKCRKFKMENDIKLVIIDYLQLMSGNGKGEGRQQEVSEISRSLKALAREIKAPILALSQLSRQVEQRPDRRPMLSDLRESGAIEQDADVVMFIYRDDYYHKDTEKKGVAEVIIAKQRNGPIGTVELAWLPEYTKFVNIQK